MRCRERAGGEGGLGLLCPAPPRLSRPAAVLAVRLLQSARPPLAPPPPAKRRGHGGDQGVGGREERRGEGLIDLNYLKIYAIYGMFYFTESFINFL